MSPTTYKRIVLNERPITDIQPSTFRTETLRFDALTVGDGQALIQVTWLSLDPAMRGWLNDVRSYIPPVQIGAVMRALGLGVVLKVGNSTLLKEGDLVSGACGMFSF